MPALSIPPLDAVGLKSPPSPLAPENEAGGPEESPQKVSEDRGDLEHQEEQEREEQEKEEEAKERQEDEEEREQKEVEGKYPVSMGRPGANPSDVPMSGRFWKGQADGGQSL
jgi:hypothetical protein